MDKMIIRGGRPLVGSIRVSGAKNAALPILACSLLGQGTSSFYNVPDLDDVRTMGKLLSYLGCEVEIAEGRHHLRVTPPGRQGSSCEAPYELVKTMRASILVLGPLLARYGRARVSLPGGCAIGARPIDQHLRGLEAMGAKVELSHGYVECSAKQLCGATLHLDMPTVTGSENLMMAAALADGRTTLENAAREPEVEELARVLNKMGAHIQGAGTSTIQIEGTPELAPAEHSILPDRIEAGTFMIAAAATRGEVLLQDARVEDLESVIRKLRACGVRVEVSSQNIRVTGAKAYQPLDIATKPHPGFPTDMQAQFMVLACLAPGESVITETIFENRFMHVPELCRMGADIQIDGRVAIVNGGRALSGTKVMATDLRASASLVLAGLVAEGTTEIRRIYHLDRGYEHLEDKLRACGAEIKRVSE